jgi:GxxExxY protein
MANRRQVTLPLCYKGVKLDCGYRLDLLLEERVPLELKAVSQLLPIHEAQLLTYLRIGRFPLGLLINFNVALLKEGIRRRVETREWQVPPLDHEEFRGIAKFDHISATVVMAAIEVHRQLGPGLLVSAYEECLGYELAAKKTPFERKKKIPLLLDGETLSSQAEIPLLAGSDLPVFPLCADTLTPVHTATALARLRQGSWKQSLLLNFHAPTMLQGIKRIVL